MKDWELHLALMDPMDPIHDHIEAALEEGENDVPADDSVGSDRGHRGKDQG